MKILYEKTEVMVYVRIKISDLYIAWARFQKTWKAYLRKSGADREDIIEATFPGRLQ